MCACACVRLCACAVCSANSKRACVVHHQTQSMGIHKALGTINSWRLLLGLSRIACVCACACVSVRACVRALHALLLNTLCSLTSAGFSLVPASVQLLAIFFIPESPRWLFLSKNREGAARSEIAHALHSLQLLCSPDSASVFAYLCVCVCV